MSCMTWSSMTWTQVNMIVKTWQPPQIWNPAFSRKTWQYPKFWNVTFFCSPMSPSLDNDCSIQDLAFQVLKLFGVKHFNIIDPCHESCLSWLGLPRHEHIWNYFSRLGSHSSEILHVFKTWNPKFWNVFLQFHVPKSWQWLHYSRLGFPTLETFWAK